MVIGKLPLGLPSNWYRKGREIYPLLIHIERPRPPARHSTSVSVISRLTAWLASNVAHAERRPERVRDELLAQFPDGAHRAADGVTRHELEHGIGQVGTPAREPAGPAVVP